MTNDDVTVIIPTFNEENRIGPVIKDAKSHVDEVIVVDDNSTDDTASMAEEAGATVIANTYRSGYIGALKSGFEAAESELIVTMDADGEHDPADIPNLLSPIKEGSTDVVLGQREKIARPSEKFLCSLARLRVNVDDCGTGFRALKKDIAKKLELEGHCTCGTFVLEAKSLGAEITEVPINLRSIDKPRGIAWQHIPQTWHVFRLLFR